MVFHSKAASVIKRSKYQDNPGDTSSIGSTISSNFDTARPKIGPKKAFFDNNQEWHVVPSGGSKARASYSNQHPYPFHYDEYDIYLSQDKTEDQIILEQSYETNRTPTGTNNDNKHTILKEGETTSNKISSKSTTKHNTE
jgi:hypothetical protein